METGVIIATHGFSSVELLKSAEMIVGIQKNVETITFEEGQGLEELHNSYQESLKKLSGCQSILILVDILGGSPFNVGALQKHPLIAGVNIPMLLELFMKRDTVSLDQLVKDTILSGEESIVRYTMEEEIVEHDEEF